MRYLIRDSVFKEKGQYYLGGVGAPRQVNIVPILSSNQDIILDRSLLFSLK